MLPVAVNPLFPPGVPWITPAFTPRKNKPALVRRTSVSAIGMLYRWIATSRLFSIASDTASCNDRYIVPFLNTASMRGLFA